MSDYEQYVGTCEKVSDLPLSDEVKKNITETLKLGEMPEDCDSFEEWITEGRDKAFVFTNNALYKIREIECIDDEDIAYAKQAGEQINFVLRYYNGGTCFSECLVEALEKVEEND